MVNDLIEVIRKLASSSAPETVVPNDRTNAIDHISTSTQNSIKLAAKIGNAIEAGEEKGWDIDNQESLIQLYNSISGDRVKIRLTSRSDKPYKYMSFDVKGSDKSAIKGLSIGYYDHNGRLSDMRNSSTIGITISGFGRPNLRLGTFESGDKNYKLWSSIFNKARDVKHATYEYKQFLNLVLSSLRDAMIDAIGTSTSTETTITESPEEILETSANIFNTQASVSQEVTETTPTVGKSTSTETTPTKSASTVGNTAELFNFEAAKELEQSTTKGISRTTQEIYEYNDEYNIGEKPTATPVEGQGTGMSIAAIIGIAGKVVGLGLMAAGAFIGCRAWSRGNREEYNMNTVEKARNGDKRFDSENPRISKITLPKTARSADVSNGGAEAESFIPKGEAPTKPPRSGQTEPKVVDGSPKTPTNTLRVHAEINKQLDQNLESLRNSLSSSSIANSDTRAIEEVTPFLDHGSEVYSLRENGQYNSQEIQRQLQPEEGNSNPSSSLLLSSNLKEALRQNNTTGLSWSKLN